LTLELRAYAWLSIVGEDWLTALADASSWVTVRNVCQGAQGEILSQDSAKFLYKGFPHQPTSSVVWEGEIYRFVEELFELLLTAGVRLTCATNNGNSEGIFNKLALPFSQSLFDTLRSIRVFLCLLPFLALFLSRPDFLRLINIDNTWLVFLCHKHYSCYQLVVLFLSSSEISLCSFEDHWGKIKHDWICLWGNSLNNVSFSTSWGAIE